MNTKALRLIIITISLVSLIGCGIRSNARDDFPYDLMIGLADLPKGFQYGDSGFPEIESAKSFYLTYGRDSDKLGALIRHQITIYPDIEAAQRSLPVWENEWFTDSWSQTEESKFRPSDQEDIYSLKCLPAQIDGRQSKSCRMLQQHNNLVILVLVNIDSENMSFAEFDTVLKRLDSRLPVDPLPMPNSNSEFSKASASVHYTSDLALFVCSNCLIACW